MCFSLTRTDTFAVKCNAVNTGSRQFPLYSITSESGEKIYAGFCSNKYGYSLHSKIMSFYTETSAQTSEDQTFIKVIVTRFKRRSEFCSVKYLQMNLMP